MIHEIQKHKSKANEQNRMNKKSISNYNKIHLNPTENHVQKENECFFIILNENSPIIIITFYFNYSSAYALYFLKRYHVY